MKNSRLKGHNYERALLAFFRPLWPQIKTTRETSRALDAQGVDFTGTPGFYLQAKATETTPRFHDILKKMPRGKIRCVCWKRNNKGTIVAMSLDDFNQLINHYDSRNAVETSQ